MFVERIALHSRQKISEAHGHEGPVYCWLRAIGGVPEVFGATAFSLAMKSR
jgi:hypothetical protein